MKLTHTQTHEYNIYTVLKALPKHVLGVRINDNFTLPGLGAFMVAAKKAHIYLRIFAKNAQAKVTIFRDNR